MVQKIISRLLRVVKTDFVKVSAWSAIATLIRMITGFVSIRVVAQIIGPSGIALVGQFLNSINMISTLSTGCIGQGVTKYVAEYHDQPEKQKLVINSAVRITLICTLITSFFVIFFNQYIGSLIFKTSEYNSVIVLFGCSIGLFSFNLLVVSILNGFKSFRKYVLVNVISSIIGLILSVILVTQMGVYGALLNSVLSQSIIIFITIYFVRKEPWFLSLFSFKKADTGIVRKLGAFTFMTLTTAMLLPLGQISIRSYLATNISLNDAGLWEGMNRLSTMYLAFITTSISTFYLPRLSELKENRQLSAEILKTMKIVLPPLAFMCLGIYLFRDVIIGLLFSTEFNSMRGLFAMQMIGDFFKIAAWLIAFLFWAKALLKPFIITEIVFNVSLVVLTRICVNRVGLNGASFAYAVNYILYFATVVFIFRKILLEKNQNKGV